MDEQTLRSILKAEEANALGFLGGKLSHERQTAMEYYLGEPFGNEVEGASQVILTDVRDTVESILPSLMKIFASGDRVVLFEPKGPEDEKQADVETEFVNHVFLQDNCGFLVLYSAFKDALLQKVGVTKTWWEEEDCVETETLTGLFPDALQKLQDGAYEGLTVLETTEREDTIEGVGAVQVYDVKVRREYTKRHARVKPVPPEEFLIARDAVDIKTARYCAHRKEEYVSDLIAMGFPRSKVEEAGSSYDDSDVEQSDERVTRREVVDESAGNPESGSLDPSMRKVWVTEHYIRTDYDGDGIAERRKVTTAGSTTVVLENEAWEDDWPFQSLCPILIPHTWCGLSVADLVMDLQAIKSTVLRQLLDNMYNLNNQRMLVIGSEGQVNLDDLLTNRKGGIVRALPGGDVKPLENAQPIGAFGYPLLEYLDTVKENRSGVTRYNQGLQADSLNKTATGIMQIMSAAQEKIGLIARIFAETGVKDIFLALHRLLRKHQQAPRMVRMSGQYVSIDPRKWTERLDVSISVGLGTGNKDQQAAYATQLLEVQERMAQTGAGLVTPKNAYNAAAKLVEAMGFKTPEPYFTDPEAPPKPGQPPPQQRPDPEMAKVQAEAQAKQQQMQIDAQAQQAKMQLDAQAQQAKAAQDFELARMKAEQDAAIAREKALMDAQIQRERMAAEIALKREELAATLEMKREQMRMDAALKGAVASADAARADRQAEQPGA